MLHVAKGDIVIASPRSRKSLHLKVTEVIKRYVKSRSNPDKLINPLVVGVDIETREEKRFDLNFITEVVDRCDPPHPFPQRNYFEGAGTLVDTTGGTYCGYLSEITKYVLARLPANYLVDRPLSDKRLFGLFVEQTPGLIDRQSYYRVEVNKKPFNTWVRQNYSRLMLTSDELTRKRTRRRRREEATIRQDMEMAASGW